MLVVEFEAIQNKLINEPILKKNRALIEDMLNKKILFGSLGSGVLTNYGYGLGLNEADLDLIVDDALFNGLKKIKIPIKKEISEEWVFNQLNKEQYFKNLTNLLNNKLKGWGLDCFNIYGASYGLGVYCIYNREQKEQILKIENYLKELKINFYCEFSTAGWVYRFKISKSEENLKRLEGLK